MDTVQKAIAVYEASEAELINAIDLLGSQEEAARQQGLTQLAHGYAVASRALLDRLHSVHLALGILRNPK